MTWLAEQMYLAQTKFITEKLMESENALAIRTATEEAKALATLPAEIKNADWGAIEEMDSTDLLVPKIFHQQSNSDFVKKDLARAGDFCDSLTGEVIARRADALPIIVFGAYKTMLISRETNVPGKYEWEETVVITPQNAAQWANHPFEMATADGNKKYGLHYNYYCLLATEGHETGLPYVLTLGSTKTKAAKKLNAMLAKLKELGRPGASCVFELNSIEESNDRGSWYGINVTQGRNVTAAELLRAHAWYTKSKQQKFVVVEEAAAVDVTDDDAVPF